MVWIIFGENLLKSSLLSQKSDYTIKKEAQNNTEKGTSQQFLLLANHEEYFYLIERNPFVQTSEIGQILTKRLQLKMSHIQLTLIFSCFESYLGKICWKLLFLDQKFLYQKEAQNCSEI